MNWTPENLIALVGTIFYGVAIVCVPLATVYTILAAARAKRSEEVSLRNAASISAVSTDVARLEKNTNSISERNEAIARKLGITEGVAQERESANARFQAGPMLTPTTKPVPVADDRAAEIATRAVDAAERNAAASERNADAAEAGMKEK